VIEICFVCLGNICRSPTAEGVMQHLVAAAGLSHAIKIDSAGTGGWHAGQQADERSRAAAKRAGYELRSRARQFAADDFSRFTYIVAMDRQNLSDLRRLVQNAQDAEKLHLLRSFDAESTEDSDVPDPYYGEQRGFDDVVTMCEKACAGLLEKIRKQHGL
jgi:protein-tyrosine phosphatase